jgi:hypothetical protein
LVPCSTRFYGVNRLAKKRENRVDSIGPEMSDACPDILPASRRFAVTKPVETQSSEIAPLREWMIASTSISTIMPGVVRPASTPVSTGSIP